MKHTKRPRDRCNKCVEMRKLRPLEALEEINAYPRYSRRQEGLIKTLSAPQSVKCFYATPTLTEESSWGVKMRIASTSMRMNGEEREQESIFSTREGKENIEKWVKWFKKELLDALENGEDVEILIGLKPNNGEFIV